MHIDFNFIVNIINIHINNMKPSFRPGVPSRASYRWTDELEEEDLSFIKRFVLASGSLKELSGVYGISYPTIRLRLDRLIEKIKLLEREDLTDPFERILRVQHAEGRVDRHTLKLLLDAYQTALTSKRSEVERSSR